MRTIRRTPSIGLRPLGGGRGTGGPRTILISIGGWRILGYGRTRRYNQRRDFVCLTRFCGLLNATISTVSDEDDVIAIDTPPVVASASFPDVILKRLFESDRFLWFVGGRGCNGLGSCWSFRNNDRYDGTLLLLLLIEDPGQWGRCGKNCTNLQLFL